MINMRILVINGPNLNMLGMREPEVYGTQTYSDLCNYLISEGQKRDIEVIIKQSNSEGELVTFIQDAFYDLFDGVIINAGAYTHYSYAIHDSLMILRCPKVEVHLSDIDHREEFRKISVIRDAVTTSCYGKGFMSYLDGIEFIQSYYKNK